MKLWNIFYSLRVLVVKIWTFYERVNFGGNIKRHRRLGGALAPAAFWYSKGGKLQLCQFRSVAKAILIIDVHIEEQERVGEKR